MLEPVKFISFLKYKLLKTNNQVHLESLPEYVKGISFVQYKFLNMRKLNVFILIYFDEYTMIVIPISDNVI